MTPSFYITTTLPYVNAEPHIGFGLEIVEADVIARYQQQLGKQVIFNTGTDEHGQKIYDKALEANLEPQVYCDQYAEKYSQLKKLLNLSFTHFIRTTNPNHQKATQEFWKRSLANGDIYKAKYQIKYCVGCELEKTESELTDGRCSVHPHLELEIREEENYFFKFSKYQQLLLNHYKNIPNFVQPDSKMNEAVAFVQRGLNDFSISRLRSKMPWGVTVPDDPDHVMYVWFDALVSYISTLGWPSDKVQFQKYWPAIQVAGKDNLRQQAVMWQAMLFSASLPPSKKILINGFISIDGQKMSKSLGNVISPEQMVNRYGVDATRFLLISLGCFSQDMDVSWKKFDLAYTANLANGLGNLCSRVTKMASDEKLAIQPKKSVYEEKYKHFMDGFELTQALNCIIDLIKKTDLFLSQKQPWTKQGEEKKLILTFAVEQIRLIAFLLSPFMPSVSQRLLDHFQKKIQPMKPLFPRVE